MTPRELALVHAALEMAAGVARENAEEYRQTAKRYRDVSDYQTAAYYSALAEASFGNAASIGSITPASVAAAAEGQSRG